MRKILVSEPSAILTIHSPLDPTKIVALAAEADTEGHRMVSRLLDDWKSGRNRFDKPGERSYLATLDGHACGVCGLNIDPFAADESIGRIRRLYVSRSVRRRGIASAIIQRLLRDSMGRFHVLRLRTLDPGAAAFYESIGFTRVMEIESCSHVANVPPIQ